MRLPTPSFPSRAQTRGASPRLAGRTRGACRSRVPRPSATPLQAVLRGSLRKAFSGLDMLLLGLGVIIGTGIYTVTGTQLDVSG